MKYRKKPVVIEAWQFRKGEDARGVCHCNEDLRSHLHTMHGGQVVALEDGDWIIPEPDGVHFYPCKPDVFAKTYEPVDADGFDPPEPIAGLDGPVDTGPSPL